MTMLASSAIDRHIPPLAQCCSRLTMSAATATTKPPSVKLDVHIPTKKHPIDISKVTTLEYLDCPGAMRMSCFLPVTTSASLSITMDTCHGRGHATVKDKEWSMNGRLTNAPAYLRSLPNFKTEIEPMLTIADELHAQCAHFTPEEHATKGMELIAGKDWKVPPSIPFPSAMHVVKLRGGGVALISPIVFGDELKERTDALGGVKMICAPNAVHHLWAGNWHDAYPEAVMVVCDSLVSKRPDLKYNFVMPQDEAKAKSDPLLSQFEFISLEGAWNNGSEVLVYDHDSKTIFGADIYSPTSMSGDFGRAMTEAEMPTNIHPGLLASMGLFNAVFGVPPGHLPGSHSQSPMNKYNYIYALDFMDPAKIKAAMERLEALEVRRVFSGHLQSWSDLGAGGKAKLINLWSWVYGPEREEFAAAIDRFFEPLPAQPEAGEGEAAS